MSFGRSYSYPLSNPQGNITLTDADVQTIVAGAIWGGVPLDTNGVYFVLGASNVTEAGLCTQFCGWHYHGTIWNADLKYAFIGNPARCPANCAPPSNVSMSPNGNVRADAMVSIVAHELEEAVTDPSITSWYDLDASGNDVENADRCAWTFGSTYAIANGSRANMRLGSRDFLVQQNCSRGSNGSSQRCALSYP